MARKLRPGVHTVTVKGKRRKVRVLRSGQWRFMKGKGKAKKRRRSSTGRRKRRSNPVARRKKNKKNRNFTIPLAPTIGLAAGLSPTLFGFQGSQGKIDGAIWHFQNRGPAAGVKEFIRCGSMTFLGYDPEGFEPFGKYLGLGIMPVVLGMLVHVLASKLGVNRMLGQYKVPVIRI